MPPLFWVIVMAFSCVMNVMTIRNGIRSQSTMTTVMGACLLVLTGVLLVYWSAALAEAA